MLARVQLTPTAELDDFRNARTVATHMAARVSEVVPSGRLWQANDDARTCLEGAAKAAFGSLLAALSLTVQDR